MAKKSTRKKATSNGKPKGAAPKKAAKKTTKKKVAKRTDPESGKSIPAGQLGDWKERVSDRLQELADNFVECRKRKNKAKQAEDNAKAACLDQMKKEKIPKMKVMVGNTEQWLKTTVKEDLKTEAIKKEDQ